MTPKQKPRSERLAMCISERKILQFKKTANAKVLRPVWSDRSERGQSTRALQAMVHTLLVSQFIPGFHHHGRF